VQLPRASTTRGGLYKTVKKLLPKETWPQNGDRIVTLYSVTSVYPMYISPSPAATMALRSAVVGGGVSPAQCALLLAVFTAAVT